MDCTQLNRWLRGEDDMTPDAKLITELRQEAATWCEDEKVRALMLEAADLIERLRQEGFWAEPKVWEQHPLCAKAADRLAVLSADLAASHACLRNSAAALQLAYDDNEDLRQSLNVLGDKYDELSEKYHILKGGG